MPELWDSAEMLRHLKRNLPQISFIEETTIPSGQSSVEHSHLDLGQINILLSGQGRITIDGLATTISHSSIYLVAPGRLHEIICDGEDLKGITLRYSLSGYLGGYPSGEFRFDSATFERALQLLRGALDTPEYDSDFFAVLANIRLAEFLLLVLQGQKKALSNIEYSDLVSKALHMMRKDFNQRLTTQHIADDLGVTVNHFCRIFKSEVGQSPLSFLQRIRISHATERLFRTRDSFEAIASDAGFGSCKNMRVAFQKHVGMSPQAIRRKRYEE